MSKIKFRSPLFIIKWHSAPAAFGLPEISGLTSLFSHSFLWKLPLTTSARCYYKHEWMLQNPAKEKSPVSLPIFLPSKPMHSQSALTELPSPNLAPFLFLFHPSAIWGPPHFIQCQCGRHICMSTPLISLRCSHFLPLSCIPISPFRQRRRGRPSVADDEDDALLEHCSAAAAQLQSSPSQLLLVKAKSEVSLSAASQPPQPVESGNAPNKGEKGCYQHVGHLPPASVMRNDVGVLPFNMCVLDPK